VYVYTNVSAYIDITYIYKSFVIICTDEYIYMYICIYTYMYKWIYEYISVNVYTYIDMTYTYK